MADRKRKTTRKKPHYVRNKKRKGAESAVVAQRTVVVTVLFLILASIIVGVGMGFRWIDRQLFSDNPRFEIQHLDITCTGDITEENIRAWSGLSEGMNLFSFSLDEVKSMMEQVPVVESVELRRDLPNTLYITVKERVPVARILLKRYRYPCPLDRYGFILSPKVSPEIAQLPLVKGLEADLKAGDRVTDPDVECVLEILALCDSNRKLNTFIPIASLDIKYDDYIDMRLDGGIRVRMPRYHLQPKLQNLATIIQMSQEQGRRVKEVDLTLDSGKAPVRYY